MNRNVKRTALVVMALLLALPALGQGASMQQRWAGSWFGTGQPDDRSEMFIDTFNADGSFRNQHRWCRQGKATDLTESGRWRIEGNTLVIDIATVNGQPDVRSDRYRVNSNDGKVQDYTYLKNNFNYKARKVAGNFPMPPCDLSA
jgi:hypothetical protein